MIFCPILACGPSAEVIYAILGILGAGALSVVTGLVCLCTGHRSLGTFLVGTPVTLFGLIYLWISVH